jgi:hypothetical protein
MLSIITGSVRSVNANVWAFIACMGIAASGCDKMPLLAPQQSTITVSSNSSVVQANGTAQIRATVLEQSGTPVQNGTTVTFTTNLGAVSPTEARTVNGVATVQFVGNGQSGRAQIRALSGGAVSDALELSVGAAATGRVNVTANPTSVAATGGTSTITATVVDASGNPLAGVPVTFSTTAGTLTPSVASTDFTGTATTSLSTSREASVTATAGGTTSTAVVVGVAVRPTLSISVAAGSTPTEGAVTPLSVTVTPAANGAPIQSVIVDYGDGTSDNLGSIGGTVTVQHVYRDSGSFTPTVTVQDTSGTSASTSTVIFVQPLLVSISSSRTGSTVTFTANVPDGVTVSSTTWDFGDGDSQTTASTTTSHTYTAAGTYTVRVTARTSTGESKSGTTAVTIP